MCFQNIVNAQEFLSTIPLINHKFVFYLFIDAEEAQSKIEELRDQEYNERRSAILTQNDIEMNELLQ